MEVDGKERCSWVRISYKSSQGRTRPSISEVSLSDNEDKLSKLWNRDGASKDQIAEDFQRNSPSSPPFGTLATEMSGNQ